MQGPLTRGTAFVSVAPYYAEAATSAWATRGIDGAVAARLPLLGALTKLATDAFTAGSAPLLTDSASTGGAYFLRTPDGLCLGVLKPQDEEPFAVNNPKGHVPEVNDVSYDRLSNSSGGIAATDTEDDEEEDNETLRVLSRNAAVRSEAASLHRRLPGLPETGRNMIRRGVRPGDGVIREAAAFLLDHGGRAAVPPTTLVLARHSALYASSAYRKAYIAASNSPTNNTAHGRSASEDAAAAPIGSSEAATAALYAGLGTDFLETIAALDGASCADNTCHAPAESMRQCARCGGYRNVVNDAAAKSIRDGCAPILLPALTASSRMWPPVKHCSFQAFVPHACSAEDFSSNVWPVEEVHKIAINDIRLCNTDRNTDNILCRAWLPGDAALNDLRSAEAQAVAAGAAAPTPSLVRYWKDVLKSRNVSYASAVKAEDVAKALMTPASAAAQSASTQVSPHIPSCSGYVSAVSLSNNASGACGPGVGGGSNESVVKPTTSPTSNGRPPRPPLGSPRGITGGIAANLSNPRSASVKEVLTLAPFGDSTNASTGASMPTSSMELSGKTAVAAVSASAVTGLSHSVASSPSQSPSRAAFTSYIPPHRRSALLTAMSGSSPLTTSLSLDAPEKSSTLAVESSASVESLSSLRHISFRGDGPPAPAVPLLTVNVASAESTSSSKNSAPSSPTTIQFLSHARGSVPLFEAVAGAEALAAPGMDKSQVPCVAEIAEPRPACSLATPDVLLGSVVASSSSSSSTDIPHGNVLTASSSNSSSSVPSPELHPLAGGNGSLTSSDHGITIRDLRAADRIELVPIDHGLCLPSASHLQDVSFCWTGWKQCDAPLSEDSIKFIDSLDGRRDSLLLWSVFGGPSMRKDSLLTLRLSTALLQEGVRVGLSLSEIGRMMCRLDGLGRVAASTSESAPGAPSEPTDKDFDEAEARRRAKNKKKRADRAKVKSRQRERARARQLSESGESAADANVSICAVDDVELLPSAFEQCVRKARASWRSARKRLGTGAEVTAQGSEERMLREARSSTASSLSPSQNRSLQTSPSQSRCATRTASLSDMPPPQSAKVQAAAKSPSAIDPSGVVTAPAKKSWNVPSKAARARAASRRRANSASSASEPPSQTLPAPQVASDPATACASAPSPSHKAALSLHECVCGVYGNDPYFLAEHDAIEDAFRAHLKAHLHIVLGSRRS